MSVRRTVTRALELLAVAVVLSLLVGQFLGQPVLLAFVETGSMAPTLEPGDGFVAIPTQLAGPMEEGDVVTFRAEEIQGGGLTTHRVVGETDRGYVTRGDANPFTDQDGDEPPVKDAQIVAVAWQPGGEVFVVPALGTAVEAVQGGLEWTQRTLASLFGTRSLLGTQGIAYLLFGVTVLYYLAGEFRSREGRDRGSRDRGRETGLDSRLIVLSFTLLLVGSMTAAMVGPAGQQQYGVVSAEFESERPTVIPMGESNTIPYAVGNNGFVPVYVYVEPASEGVTVEPHRLRVERGEVRNTSVTLSAPPQTGYYRRFVVEHRYLALLPPSTIDVLHAVHPWVPIVVIDLLIGVPFYLLGVGLLGSGRIRRRTRKKETNLGSSVRDTVRRWYS
ncbi:S26 family signal peptidase [Salinigranum marinum]|uniref:S26 family signal peptidase n=1 Tax=Salinigranum marinum TaxID=1515595 RepID=UPI002989F7F7|nr:S26 family signal peptidase [Salinigranum marinum]